MNTPVIVCDFETTSIYNYDIENCVRVWHWCAVSVDTIEVLNKGYNIESYIEYLSSLKTTKIYFHNEAFDISYIIDYLLRNNFTVTQNVKPQKNEFSILIDELGKVYSAKFNFNGKSTITIYDSFKLFLTSVDNIARGFALPETKGKIDYVKYRPLGYIPTEEEEEYIENDCKIVARALQRFLELGLSKSTLASNALHFYKLQLGDKVFNALFPVLPIDIDDFIRKSYKGGFVAVNEKYKNKIVNNIQIYDVKSLYPSVMINLNNNGLPFGLPRYFEGKYIDDEKYPLYIQHIKLNFELKKGYIPIIQIKKSLMFNDREYLKSSEGLNVDLYLTNVDLELVMQFYHINYIEYIDGYKFREKKGYFNDYVKYWYDKKYESELQGNKAMRQISKIFLNGLSGKFGTKTRRRNKIPYLDEEKDVIRFYLSEEEECKPIYTATISFITAYARKKTITTILKYLKVGGCDKDRWIYSDTDSVHLIAENDAPILECGKELGCWDYEHYAKSAKYIRAKTYIYEKDEKTVVKCAGLPHGSEEVTFNDFYEGAVFDGVKLSVKRVKGGILLVPSDFTIKRSK